MGVCDVKQDKPLRMELDQQEAQEEEKVDDGGIPKGMGYHQTSTEPILRVLRNDAAGEGAAGSDSDSSSGDDDRFMEFDSSSDEEGGRPEEMIDAQSLTTKSSAKGGRRAKKPLI